MNLSAKRRIFPARRIHRHHILMSHHQNRQSRRILSLPAIDQNPVHHVLLHRLCTQREQIINHIMQLIKSRKILIPVL